MKTTSFIIINVELPFKCNFDDFEKTYKELYKSAITYDLIRGKLGLQDSVKLKLNGTFGRELYLLNIINNLFSVEYRIQTAIWIDPVTNISHYVSIFPNFIKKYCKPSLNVIEYISCESRKDDEIYTHIDDPDDLLYSYDYITRTLARLEHDCKEKKYTSLLNAKYTQIYNIPINTSAFESTNSKKFPSICSLIDVAKKFFGVSQSVLAIVNSVILL